MERNKHYFFNVASGFSHCASSCKIKQQRTKKRERYCCNPTRRGNNFIFWTNARTQACVRARVRSFTRERITFGVHPFLPFCAHLADYLVFRWLFCQIVP